MAQWPELFVRFKTYSQMISQILDQKLVKKQDMHGQDSHCFWLLLLSTKGNLLGQRKPSLGQDQLTLV